MLGSSGDGGTANTKKSPVDGPNAGPTFPYPTVEWPASDPLVTGVGGTYLCTDATATSGRIVDSVHPPVNCHANPGVAEVAWVASGGGLQPRLRAPAYQNVLPAGSTPIPATARGVPDIGLQASPRTGAQVYVSLPPSGQSGLRCPVAGGGTTPCSTGW